MAFDADSKTVFVTLQQSGRLAAFDLATQTLKWNVAVGNTPAGVLMLPDNKRLLVALTGEDGVVVVDPKDGTVTGRLQTGKGAHNFWPKGDGRHWFLSNRVEGTVSLIDTQDMKVVGTVKVPGGPDCMDITPDGKELWVTQRFLRRVAVVDLEQMKVVASIPVGKSPHGVFMLKSRPARRPPCDRRTGARGVDGRRPDSRIAPMRDLIDLWVGVQNWLFETFVSPVLFGLGLMAWYEPAFNAVEFFMLGVVQIAGDRCSACASSSGAGRSRRRATTADRRRPRLHAC